MVVFRNDDVNSNTDPEELECMYNVIRGIKGPVEILSAVSVFSKYSDSGAVYPEAPFKDKPLNWFYDVNQVVGNMTLHSIASHGLYHIDHTKVNKETQEMSILGSCNYLNTRTFVPPFNKWNEDTKDICEANNISLVGPGQEWKSLEFNEFDPNHNLWYFHSWRYTLESLKEALWGKKSV